MALKTLTVFALGLLTQCNSLALQPRQQNPSIPVRNSPDAPVDSIPGEFTVAFSSEIAQKGGWDSKRYFTNSLQWILELGTQDFHGEIGAVQLWAEGTSFNLKAHPQSNSTFPRRHLLWGLYKGLEYRLKNADWRPGQFDLKWNNQTTGVLEFVDKPDQPDTDHRIENTALESDLDTFRINSTWLSKVIVDDNDLFLAIARMALSTAVFGPGNVVPSPQGWQHILILPTNKTSGPSDTVQINVLEPAHPGGELKLKWQWVSYLLQQALRDRQARHFSSDLQVQLFNKTTESGKVDELLGTLKIVTTRAPSSSITPLDSTEEIFGGGNPTTA